MSFNSSLNTDQTERYTSYLIVKLGTSYKCKRDNNNVASAPSFNDSYISIVLGLFIVYFANIWLSVEAQDRYIRTIKHREQLVRQSGAEK